MSARRRFRESLASLGHKRELSPRDLELRARVLQAAPAIIYAEGFAGATLSLIADGFRISVPRLRRVVADREELLFLVLEDYVLALRNAFAAIAPDAPDRAAALRAAYHGAAHEGPNNDLSVHHALRLGEARMLPPDLMQRFRQIWTETLRIVEPDDRRRPLVMALLDGAGAAIEDVEALLSSGVASLAELPCRAATVATAPSPAASGRLTNAQNALRAQFAPRSPASPPVLNRPAASALQARAGP